MRNSRFTESRATTTRRKRRKDQKSRDHTFHGRRIGLVTLECHLSWQMPCRNRSALCIAGLLRAPAWTLHPFCCRLTIAVVVVVVLLLGKILPVLRAVSNFHFRFKIALFHNLSLFNSCTGLPIVACLTKYQYLYFDLKLKKMIVLGAARREELKR